MDNKAVAEGAYVTPFNEVSDLDLRQQLSSLVSEKSLTVTWIPSHRQESTAATKQEKHFIQQNNRADALAKEAAHLPLPAVSPSHPADIHVAGGPAPTPARKWVLLCRKMGSWSGVLWTTWLPLRGQRRMLWLQWLWGNVRWAGCGAPWEKARHLCELCNTSHETTVHAQTGGPSFGKSGPCHGQT